MQLKLEELAKSIVSVRTSIGELKRACGLASSSGSGRGSVSKFDEYLLLRCQILGGAIQGDF
jgi:hypothetical protein